MTAQDAKHDDPAYALHPISRNSIFESVIIHADYTYFIASDVIVYPTCVAS